MNDYQKDFIEFVISTGALKFGNFQLKSGRMSPYFFNTGVFDTGGQLARLGKFYAHAIEHWGAQFDLLFGPAYKGIPLVTATAMALAQEFGREAPFAFNRKEVKDHGEGGVIVGHPLQGRVIIIDDVISAGISVAESVRLIVDAGAEAAGIIIALDRQEKAQGSQYSAIDTVIDQYRMEVRSIISLETLIEYLEQNEPLHQHLGDITAYRHQYGI